MKTAIKRTSKFLQDKYVDNSSRICCQYIDEFLRNTARFQAKASKNVHDFHTIFEEIKKRLRDAMRPKVIRRSIEFIIERMNRLITVACWRISIVQMKPELWNNLIFLHLIQLI
ncbi:unnamed protein product [Acanthoscelides obtectus]|uniref:Uncharacterized protein n=1 Tax=Acanthoscelides obtectus TaxID=200917 RepID=A0A9P0K448_ACAOB|nr:unnamed protein product [Acanthoscelides obtectus]CAK1653982.1 hypothetical protein AOBTE_LOCUS18414 [Acanthoscelides obtectus]